MIVGETCKRTKKFIHCHPEAQCKSLTVALVYSGSVQSMRDPGGDEHEKIFRPRDKRNSVG